MFIGVLAHDKPAERLLCLSQFISIPLVIEILLCESDRVEGPGVSSMKQMLLNPNLGVMAAVKQVDERVSGQSYSVISH